MPRHRVLFIAALLFFPFLAAEARLFYLQGVKADEYRERILRKRTGLFLLPVPRGRILDRHGEPLAEDRRAFDLRIRLGDFLRDARAFDNLCVLLDAPRADIASRVRGLQSRIEEQLIGRPLREERQKRDREYRTPYPLVDDIPFQAALLIESHPERFPGLDVEEKLRRRYPLGGVAAHVVGHIGIVNPEEYRKLLADGYFRGELGEAVDDDDYEAFLNRGVFKQEVVGRRGVEARFHARLRGRRGVIVRERDTLTGALRTDLLSPPQPGGEVVLTLDAEAQRRAEEALKNSHTGRGAIVAMEVGTGEVLVMASAPAFDPNDLAPPPNNAAIARLYAPGSGFPFQNRALASAYPLGSIFKIVVGTGALQDGKVGRQETFTCAEPIRLGQHDFDCWIFDHGVGHGAQDIVGGLQRSCNLYFYNTGRRLGGDGIVDWARRLGFGTRSGTLEIAGETAGHLPAPPANGKWNLGDVYNLSIGQGPLEVTPLQVCRMVCAIANGGKLPAPRLVRDGMPPPASVDLGLSAVTLDGVRRGMWAVVNEEGGTGLKSGMSRFHAAGKTSTAQAPGGNHAWFACYFPFDTPRYAVVIFAENAGKGSEAAAPLAVPVAEALTRFDAATPEDATPGE